MFCKRGFVKTGSGHTQGTLGKQEESKKMGVFSAGSLPDNETLTTAQGFLHDAQQVRKTPVLSHFNASNDQFTKTGSGQT